MVAAGLRGSGAEAAAPAAAPTRPGETCGPLSTADVATGPEGDATNPLPRAADVEEEEEATEDTLPPAAAAADPAVALGGDKTAVFTI